MKRNYSIYNPHRMCKNVHKPEQELKILFAATLNVDISNLSTIPSSAFYDAGYNVIRQLAVLSTNSLCL